MTNTASNSATVFSNSSSVDSDARCEPLRNDSGPTVKLEVFSQPFYLGVSEP